MGKRPAEVDRFEGNTGSIQWEDSGLYSKRGITSRANGNRTDSSAISVGDEALVAHGWRPHVVEH